MDPAMADHGKLYRGFDETYVRAMAGLCGCADILLPNLTEACFLTGTEYMEGELEESYVRDLLEKLSAFGALQSADKYMELSEAPTVRGTVSPPPSPEPCCREAALSTPPFSRRISSWSPSCRPRTIRTTGTV